MVCEHLNTLEKELINANIKITYRGQPWEENCREWVYFNCFLDKESLEKRFNFSDFVEYYEHLDKHDGAEAGFICKKCNDAIMGHHKHHSKNKFVF